MSVFSPMTVEQSIPVDKELADRAKEIAGTLIISSEELLKGRREMLIEHEGQLYRLRVTSRGKLYLTK